MFRYLYLVVIFIALQACKQKDTSAKDETGATEQVAEAFMMNPPHGQPGHICEVPVGEPIPVSQPNAVQNVNLKTPLMQRNQRLNPAHGQPGHICEIPVGQPLP